MYRVNTESRWAVFCRVIDNHGDLGVCWRLASQLAARGHAVDLYIDDASALHWMAPQGRAGVQVRAWPADDAVFQAQAMPAVVIEAFGGSLPHGYQAAMAQAATSPVWINLEYFSAEEAALRNHGLPSPVQSGPAKGLTKWFFYPGLSPHSGGILGPGDAGRTPLLASASASPPPRPDGVLRVSLFCYEPASLGRWLQQLQQLPQAVHLKVTAGRATAAVRQALQAWTEPRHFQLEELPYLSHAAFDQLLGGQDLNLVRGEDSLVRAIWAGRPFLWQIYPQDDGVHHIKLQAFLQASQAPPVVVQAHTAWNAEVPTPLPLLTPQTLLEWRTWAHGLQQSLLAQTDLLTRLESFVSTHG